MEKNKPDTYGVHRSKLTLLIITSTNGVSKNVLNNKKFAKQIID